VIYADDHVLLPTALIFSMITINGINIAGVPWGTKCSKMWLAFLIHPNNINLIHKCRVRFSVSVKCLVLVKIYGNNPRKLFVRIIGNSDIRINEFPLFSFPFFRIVFISWCSLFISNLIIILFHERISQILAGISRSPIAVLVQFSGRLLISVVGSKIENKFLITFTITDRLTENGRHFEIKNNVENSTVRGTSRQPSPLQVMRDQK